MSFITERANLLGDHGSEDMEWDWSAFEDGNDGFVTKNPSKKPTRLLNTADAGSSNLTGGLSNRSRMDLKRPRNVAQSVVSDSATKRKKLDSSPLPKPSTASSLLIRDTACSDAKPAVARSSALPAQRKVVKGPFLEISSDDSDNEDSSVPAAKKPSLAKALSTHSIPMDNPERALAQSACMRREAAMKRLARQEGIDIQSSPAPTTSSKASGTHSRQIPPPRTKDTTRPQPKPASGTRPRADDGRRSTKKQAAEVIDLDPDTDTLPKRPPLFSSRPQTTSDSFKEQPREVKKEHPLPLTRTAQLAVQRSKSAAEVEARREQVREEAVRAADTILTQERLRAFEHAKVLAEQQRRKQEDAAAVKRQEEEQARIQLAKETEARKAAIERYRQQEQAEQRQKDADEQQNRIMEEQIKKLRVEGKQRKAEDEAKREAERQRLIEERRAELVKRPPVLNEEARHNRDERTRLWKERAARNKQAQQDDEDKSELVAEEVPTHASKSLAARAREARVIEEPITLHDGDDDGHRPHTPAPTPASGPVSLNSVAGLRAINGASKPMRHVPGTTSTQPDRTSHSRVLGEILSEDACILKWRDTGSAWDQIKVKYLDLTGKDRSEGTLRARFRQVTRALNEARVDAGLRRRMLDEDEEARRHANIAVHGEWPIARGIVGSPSAGIDTIHGERPVQFKKKVTFEEPANELMRNTIPVGSLPAPGEILPADALLVCLRRGGEHDKMPWVQVVKKYAAATGVRRSKDMLKQRHDEVKGALEDAIVHQDEIQALSTDATGLRAKVNGKVWGRWPPVPRDRPQHTESPARKPSGQSSMVPRHDSPLDKPILGAAVSGQHASDDAQTESQEQRPRLTIGGKTITWDIWKLWLQHQEEAYKEVENIEFDEYDSDVDENDPEDYYRWVYRLFRREYTLEDQEGNIDIEDVEWQECEETFEDLEEANAAAADEILLQAPSRPAFQEGDYQQMKEVNNWFHHYTIVNHQVGQLDVFVHPVKLTPKDRILPKTKEGWIHDTIYHVKQCITKKEKTTHDVLDETVIHESKKEIIIEHTLTSDLQRANARAIHHFLALTRTRLRKLERDDRDRLEREAWLMAELEASVPDGEEATFNRTHKWQDKDKTLRVWVDTERLTGPRNLYKFSK